MSNVGDHEVDPECWEDSFSVSAPMQGFPPYPPGTEEMWSVMEAECATVCYCATERAAKVIVHALNETWQKTGGECPTEG